MDRVIRPLAPDRFGCHCMLAANCGQRKCETRCCRSLEGSIGGRGSGAQRPEMGKHGLEHTDCPGFVQRIVSVAALG